MIKRIELVHSGLALAIALLASGYSQAQNAVNSASVTAPALVNDSNTVNNTATDTDPITRSSNLSLSLSDSPDPVAVGNLLTYTLTVSNAGPSVILPSSTSSIVASLPAGLSGCVYTPSGGTFTVGTIATGATGTGTWTGITIAASGSANLTITCTVTAAAAASITNTATFIPPTGSTDPDCSGAPVSCAGGNTATATTAVSRPQLTISKTASAPSFTVGVPASYTLQLSNTGTSATTATSTITDTIPTGLTIGTLPPGCSAASQTVTCTVPSGLAAGGSTSFVIPVTPTAAAGASVTNTATVSGGGDSTCPANARCTSSVTVPVSGSCAAITFPYTLPDNAPGTLITAMECANANGTADVINLNGQTVTLTASYGTFSGATGLPQITTEMTIRNGTLTRTGSNEFRFLNVSNTGNLTVRDMTLTNGGGIGYAHNGGAVMSQGTASVLSVVNTTISGSRIDSLFNGSAISSNAIFTIVNSRVVGNGFGRGAIASNNGPVLIQNTLIAGNSGPNTVNGAGGLFLGNASSVTIANSTITGNYVATTISTQPGGVFASGGTINLTIRNSIIWGNSNNGNSAPQVVNATAGTNTVTNSLIQGGLFGTLNSDPLFVTPITASSTPTTAGNFQLSGSSPAIDAGANANVPADTFDVNGNSNTSEEAPDLDGNPRRFDDTGVIDTGTGTAPIVDIGAYEKQTNSSNPCGPVSFPYTLPDSAPATLRQAIICANANGTADVINLNAQTITLTDSAGNFIGATGLPEISSVLTLRNGTITRSSASDFRLLQVNETGDLTLRDMTLTNGGGATYAEQGGILNASTGSVVTIINSTVSGGRVSNALNAGGIFASGEFTLANSTVSGNSAGRGGGLALQNGPVLITNSVISGNVATSILGGGALYAASVDATIVSTTISGNYATATGATRPGGILGDISGAALTLRNTIVWGNANGDSSAPQIVNTSSFGSNTATNSIIQGGQFGALNADPLFVTPLTASATASTAGNFQLRDSSPAVDAGANANIAVDTLDSDGDSNTSEDAPDRLGNPRRFDDSGVIDTGSGTAPIVDLGAYEKQSNSAFPLLSIAKTASAAAFTVGVPASYTLQLSNTGTAATTATSTITDTIPSGLNIGTLPAGCTAASQTVTCTVASGLAAGANVSFVIPITPTLAAGTSVTNTASVSGGGDATCPAAARCSSSVGPTPVNTPQLTISKTASAASFSVGVPASYTLQLSNTGSAATTATSTITDTVPSGLTMGTLPAGCTAASQTVTCTVTAGLAAGANVSFVIPVTPTLAAGASVTNTATVSGGGDATCPTAARCSSSVGPTPVNTPQLTLSKTASAASFTVGVPASYTLQLSNTGAAATTAVSTVTDTIPSGLNIGTLPAGCTAASQTVTCTVAAGLAAAADVSFVIPVTPTLTATASVTNTASVSGGGDATCPANARCSSSVTVAIGGTCAAISFPYTLPDNAPGTLRQAIGCANLDSNADTIDLNGLIVTLSDSFASYSGATGLPQITTPVTLRNGTIRRASGAPQFRLLAISATGNLTTDELTVSGGGLSTNDDAGAIYNVGGALSIVNSTITANSAGFGGAIYNAGSTATLVLVDSQFTNNSATRNGGMLMSDGGSVSIVRSTVSSNSSSGTAGTGAIYSSQTALDIIDSTFSGNSSTTSVGAVQNFAGTTNIAGSAFTGNSAVNTAGAVLNNGAGVMTITNSIFSGNRAPSAAGALFNNGSTMTITNSTVAGNSATTGGGIFANGGTITMTNSIVWGNGSNTLVGATVSYSIFEGGFAGTGNLNVDPLFVAPIASTSAPTSMGNYQLRDASPAVDAGNNAAVPVDTFDINDNASSTDEAPDLAGNPRRYDDTGVVDTGSGTAPIVDLGAYEKQSNSAFPVLSIAKSASAASFTVGVPASYTLQLSNTGSAATTAVSTITDTIPSGLTIGTLPAGCTAASQTVTCTVPAGLAAAADVSVVIAVTPTLAAGASVTNTATVSGGGDATCPANARCSSSVGPTPVNTPQLTINKTASAASFSVGVPASYSLQLSNTGTAATTAVSTITDTIPSGLTLGTLPAGCTAASQTVTCTVAAGLAAGASVSFVIPVTPSLAAAASVINSATVSGGGDSTCPVAARCSSSVTVAINGTCATYIFPYVMAGNTPGELNQAIACANLNGVSADSINLNAQTVTLTTSVANVAGANIGLPEITTPITIRNGTITRSGTNLFRFFYNTSALSLENLTLSNGNAQADGGAIYNETSAVLTITNSRLIGHVGNFGGAIFNSNSGTATLTNALVSGNRSTNQGGGIRNRGTLVLNNSTITGNFTTTTLDGGGGIASAGTFSLTLNNSIASGNESSNFPATNDIAGAFTSNNSLVGADPSFVAPLDASDTAPTTGGNYRLGNLSAAIDAGNNSLVPGGITLDLDGNPRRFNDTGVPDTGLGTAPIVDLGAYEKQSNSPLPLLTMTKTASNTTFSVGLPASYTLQLSNTGNAATTAASTITDTIPSGLTIGTLPAGCTAASQTVTCTVTAGLAASASASFVIPVTPSLAAAASVTNTATVSGGGDSTCPAAARCTSSVTVAINGTCATYSFPYVMAGNTPGELIQAITCANINGVSADSINLNAQTVTLTTSFANVAGTNIGLPEITTPITIRNGTITRDGTNLFRFFFNSSTLSFENLTLSNADSQGDGGAIYNGPSAALNMINSRLIGNFGNFGGAIFNSSTGTTTLTNTLISGNRSNNQGGGIRNRGALILNNSTVAGNFTTAGVEGGGGIANAGTFTLTLNNSIVSGNEASNFPATNNIAGTFTSNNSLVGVDPSFVAPLDASATAPTTGGDYRLGNLSVAVDAGDNSLIPVGVTLDLDANPRRFNDTVVPDTGVGTAPIVDIGAYEKQSNSVPLQADLSISKTDGQTTAIPGSAISYTLVASNAGPVDVVNATVADTFPASITGVTWSCVGAGGASCTAAGSGNINQSVNLPSGGSVTFTANGTINPAATGLLSNTATVSSAIADPTPGNNSATDTSTLTPQADLMISKSDGQSSVNAGTNTTYTITASNLGPSNAPSTTINDTFPANCSSVSWTCTGAGGGSCPASGSGNINQAVNLPSGGSVVFTAICAISSAATGTLENTATVTPAGGVTDPTPGNNSATDTSTIIAVADLTVSKAAIGAFQLGGTASYTVTVSNSGPSPTTSAYTLTDPMPTGLTAGLVTSPDAGWNCTASTATNVSCTRSTALAAGASSTLTIPVTIAGNAPASVTNTATVAGGGEAITNNNSGSVTTTVDSITLAINDVSISEGDSGTQVLNFTVTRTGLTASAVGFSYATANGTATVAGIDYGAASGTGTIPGGGATGTTQVSVTINGDAIFENNENFFVNLSAPTNALISDDQGIGTITNDDTAPTLAIDDVSIVEGNSGTQNLVFTVTRSGLTALPASFTATTANGSATAPSDYLAALVGSTSIAAGGASGTTTLSATINGDAVAELDESFVVNLTAPSNATIADNQATGTINNDDTAGVVVVQSANSTDVTEGGATDSYTLVLTSQPTSNVSIALNPGAQLSVATSPVLFTTANWDTAQTVTVSAVDDVAIEGPHTGTISHTVTSSDAAYNSFSVPNVVANITDNDLPTLAINDATISEGDSGTQVLNFTVTRTGTTTSAVGFSFATANSTATLADGDYVAASGTGTIPAGGATGTTQVSVTINGDAIFENNENFFVNLSAPTNALISDDQGIGTITNDDAAPTLAIDDVSIVEGNSGTQNLVFTVTRSGLTALPASFTAATANGSATAPSDYLAALVGSTSIAPGGATGTTTLSATINGDLTIEANETFTVDLSAPINATITDAQGVGTITNDDGEPTFTPAAPITRQQGSPSAVATLGTVSDLTDPPNSLTVALITGGTVTGVSTTGLTNTGGAVTASLAASCTAASGTLRLQVTDSGGLSDTDDVQINVTANTGPSLAYNTINVGVGASSTQNPTASLSDNGSVTNVSVLSVGTYAGAISVSSTGVLSLSDATPAGTHSVTVRATDNCGANTDAVVQVVVAQASTFKEVTSNVQPSRFGQAVTFSAQLSGVNPTGSVEFFAGSTSLGSAPLTVSPSGGVNLKLATLTTAVLPVGNSDITVRYVGDTNNAAATSAIWVQTVSSGDSTISLTPPNNPVNTGSSVIGVSVQAVAPAVGSPAGSVSLSAGPGNSCTATLSAGSGSCALSFATAGYYPITASYTPSGNNFATSTASTALVVLATPSSTDLRVRIGNGTSNIVAGALLRYDIVVENIGTQAAVGRLEVPVSADFAGASYSCVASGPASCGAVGTGSIDTELSVGPGGLVIYSLLVTAPIDPERTITQTARITAKAPTTDLDLSNNDAADIDSMGLLRDGFEDGSVSE